MHANGHDAVIEEKPSLGAMQWSIEVRGALPINYVRIVARITGACKRLPGLSKHIKASWMQDAVLLKSIDDVPITRNDIDLLMSGVPRKLKAWFGLIQPLTELVEIKPKPLAAKVRPPIRTEVNVEVVRKRVTPRSASNEEEQLARIRKTLRGIMTELSAVDSLLVTKEGILLQKLEIWRAGEIRGVQKSAEENEKQIRIRASDAHKIQKEIHEAKVRSLDAQKKMYTDYDRVVSTMGTLYRASPDVTHAALHMILDEGVDLAASHALKGIISSVFSATGMTILLTAYRLGDADARKIVAYVINRNKGFDPKKVVTLISEIYPLSAEARSAGHMKESEGYALFVRVLRETDARMGEADYDETIRILREHCAKRLKEIRGEMLEEIRSNASAHSEIDDRRDSVRKEAHAARDARIEEIESKYLEMKAGVRSILETTAQQELGRQRELARVLFERAERLGINGEQKRRLRNGH